MTCLCRNHTFRMGDPRELRSKFCNVRRQGLPNGPDVILWQVRVNCYTNHVDHTMN